MTEPVSEAVELRRTIWGLTKALMLAEARIAQAVADEREACARTVETALVEHYTKGHHGVTRGNSEAEVFLAAAIRSRSKETQSMSELGGLIERVEKATGGSIELDGLIARALGEMPAQFRWGTKDVWGDDIGRWTAGGFGGYEFHEPEPYTSSIDAALALVDRVLPEPTFSLDRATAESPPNPKVVFPIWTCEFHWFINPAWSERADMPTAPLAICLALLRALLQREKQP